RTSQILICLPACRSGCGTRMAGLSELAKRPSKNGQISPLRCRGATCLDPPHPNPSPPKRGGGAFWPDLLACPQEGTMTAKNLLSPKIPPRIALSGRLVCMDEHSTVHQNGAIYIDSGAIVAVQDAAAPPPLGFEKVAVVSTGGTIYP